ncbi:MAG: hypothetical protein IJB30_06950 [Clostridia bacterium]|nr:hypothetical protein [Clostridia bacterium]
MGLICKIMGHDWLDGKCFRCGVRCKHETAEVVDACHDRCTVCGVLREHHNMAPTDRPGYSACSVCGYEHFNSYDYDNWQKKHQAAEKGKQELKKYLKYHKEVERKRKQETRSARCDDFLCASCGKVLSHKEHNVTYPAIPLCTGCVCKLQKLGEHLVFEHIDGYTTTYYCIRCWNYEEWYDGRHETQLLKERPCGGAAFTGTLEELMKE